MHPGLIRQREDGARERLEQLLVRPARQVGASDRATEEQIAGEQPVLRTEGDRAPRVARSVVDDELQPGQVQRLAVTQHTHVIGLTEVEPTEDGRAFGHAERRSRIRHHEPVVGVDQRRNPMRAAHGDDRKDVVEVAVGEQDGSGLEPVLSNDLIHRVFYADSWVDDDAFLAGRGRDDETVRLESSGDDTTDQHVTEATGTRSGAQRTVRAHTPFRDCIPPCLPPDANSNSPAPELCDVPSASRSVLTANE